MRLSFVMRALLAVVFVSAPALADDHIVGGYMIAKPAAGDAGGADHVALLHYDHLVSSQLEIGVATQLGYAPGNDVQSLTRFAVLPTLGVRRASGDLVLRGDVAVGWQLLTGKTKVSGVPVSGTEPRGLRAELAISADGQLSPNVALRGRLGVALDGVYPHAVPASTQLDPFVEIDLVLAL